LTEAVVCETSGADHGVNAVVYQELQVVHYDIGMREVDDRVGLAVHQLAQ
jgi:hypothetical protein